MPACAFEVSSMTAKYMGLEDVRYCIWPVLDSPHEEASPTFGTSIPSAHCSINLSA